MIFGDCATTDPLTVGEEKRMVQRQNRGL